MCPPSVFRYAQRPGQIGFTFNIATELACCETRCVWLLPFERGRGCDKRCPDQLKSDTGPWDNMRWCGNVLKSGLGKKDNRQLLLGGLMNEFRLAKLIHDPSNGCCFFPEGTSKRTLLRKDHFWHLSSPGSRSIYNVLRKRLATRRAAITWSIILCR